MKNLKATLFLGGRFGFATLTTVALAGNGQEAGEEITVAQAPPAWAGDELGDSLDEEANSEGWEQPRQQRRQRPNRARGGQARLQRITQQLGLSEEQVELLTSGRQSMQAEIQAIRAEMQSLRASTQSAHQQGNIEASEVHAMINRRAELTTEMQHLRVDAMLPFQQSLSSDQRELWQQQMRQRRSRRGNSRRGRGANRARQQQDGANQYNNE